MFGSMTRADDVPLIKADAWTFTLPSGQAFRWSSADVPFTLGPRTFVLGPGLVRDQVKWRVGISTDTLRVRITDNTALVINGQPLAAFIAQRGFDSASVTLERVFWRASDSGPVGALTWFVGEVDDGEGDRYEASITIASFTKRLEVAVPNGVYQASCLNRVFDGRCGLSSAAWVVNGVASSGSNSYRNSFNHSLPGGSYPSGWGSLGLVTMTSGFNAGVSRTVKLQDAVSIQVVQPWPAPVAAGDTFTLRAGCDRAMATCDSKFNNLNRFRGTPLVPVPETLL